MSDIAAGNWKCKVIDGFFGDVEQRIGVWLPTVRINIEITNDGPHKGQRYSYEEAVDNKQAPYIARTLKAVGWKCRKMTDVAADIAEWVSRTGGESTVEIKHIEIKRGKKFDTWVADGAKGSPPVWVKVGAIGRGPKPLRESTQENLRDADDAMRAALAEDAGRGGGSGYDDAPPPSDEDSIPF